MTSARTITSNQQGHRAARHVGLLSLVFCCAALTVGSAHAQAGSSPGQPEAPLYFQTSDYSVMICRSGLESVVANFISHGISIGDQVAHGEWLRKQKEEHACDSLEPGKRFMTSPATPVYMRSINSVEWVTKVLTPGGSKVLGYIPLRYIRFISATQIY
ncbi:hypothetical protein [Cupriavidus campinensis]|uniref:Uncharacterized protein n=1 Tax=Cupriavidus campinensis TaxID=151783 RepID=A0AAE9L1D0_9BURK|nr:hypothetical protein [Cupriavidus campinensis]URF02820.1 hypothetical protein M5D45_09575 [Cupriavidus campinensis]